MQETQAQFKLSGTVYDSSRTVPVEAVTVLSSSGQGAITNQFGHYEINVSEKDSVWFSYLNKPTVKFAVGKIYDVTRFDIALPYNMEVLQEVTLRPRNYRFDSLQNRLDYAKAFNFQRPSLGTMTTIGPNGAALDLDELIRVFQFRKNKNMIRFRERLLDQEKDKYVDHRFNKGLIRRLTGLDSANLDLFMRVYRPSYEFTVTANEFKFQTYIKDAWQQFTKQALQKNTPDSLKED